MYTSREPSVYTHALAGERTAHVGAKWRPQDPPHHLKCDAKMLRICFWSCLNTKNNVTTLLK